MEAINDLSDYVEESFNISIEKESKDWLNNLYHEYKTNLEEMSPSDFGMVMAILKACEMKRSNK